MNIAAISDGMLSIHRTINTTECIVIMGDSKQILGVGEEINSNNKQRHKSFWICVELYGISRQPIVGTCHPAPTRLSVFLRRTVLAERTQTHCGERAEEGERGEGRREKRRGADTQ